MAHLTHLLSSDLLTKHFITAYQISSTVPCHMCFKSLFAELGRLVQLTY